VRIAVLHGPNLNLLGIREPKVYGTQTLGDIENDLAGIGKDLGATLSFSQHNSEGALVEAIHALRGNADGAVINAGAYTHTSLAIRDAFLGVAIPFVEVHLSNIYAREPERRVSMLAPAAMGVVCGFGATSYELGLRGLVARLRA
jgi:3-dehydroquinate dehydratase II